MKTRYNISLDPENVEKIRPILKKQGMTLSGYIDNVIEVASKNYRKNHLPLNPLKMDMEHFIKAMNQAVKLTKMQS
jgi:hypothetical protein